MQNRPKIKIKNKSKVKKGLFQSFKKACEDISETCKLDHKFKPA